MRRSDGGQESGPLHLRELRARLGRAERFAIHSFPAPQPPVSVGASWRCGCRAAGEAFAALSLKPCAAHAGGQLDDDSISHELPGTASIVLT